MDEAGCSMYRRVIANRNEMRRLAPSFEPEKQSLNATQHQKLPELQGFEQFVSCQVFLLPCQDPTASEEHMPRWRAYQQATRGATVHCGCLNFGIRKWYVRVR